MAGVAGLFEDRAEAEDAIRDVGLSIANRERNSHFGGVGTNSRIIHLPEVLPQCVIRQTLGRSEHV